MTVQHRVLVVDDEPMNLELLERSLRRSYRVLAAQTADQALEMGLINAVVPLADLERAGQWLLGSGLDIVAMHTDQQNGLPFKPRVFGELLRQIGDKGIIQPGFQCGRIQRSLNFRCSMMACTTVQSYPYTNNNHRQHFDLYVFHCIQFRFTPPSAVIISSPPSRSLIN